MLTIHALERVAEEREALVNWLNRLLHEDTPEIEYIPRLDIRPVSLDEIKFHGTPDICIVGPRLLEDELTQLGAIRKLLPTTPIIACTSPQLEGLAQIEQIARLGATDTLSIDDTAAVLLRKIVLLSKTKTERKGGKLIVVDSGKGGVGVTSLAASLGEVAALDEKRTALVDFDFETQDLSRFLQVRPFVNENFQLLLEGSRTLSDEYVQQCLRRVWEDDDFLYHVAPPPESDVLYASDTKVLRTLLSFFEVLDEQFDCVIIDAGSARGAIQKTLYRAADEVVFVLNNDPATLYASVDRMKKIQEVLTPTANLTVVDNGGTAGLPRKMLVKEFSRAAKVEDSAWHPTGIPHCKSGAKWPASGGTFLSLARTSGREAVEALASQLGIISERRSPLGTLKQLIASATSGLSTEKGQLTDGEAFAGEEAERLALQQKHWKALPLLSEEKLDTKEKATGSLLDCIEDGEAPSDKAEEGNSEIFGKEQTPASGASEGVSDEDASFRGEWQVPKTAPASSPTHTNGSANLDVSALISKATIN
jgi:MinD-like ATPase involved in chromosome partitioning or flagellar assembly